MHKKLDKIEYDLDTTWKPELCYKMLGGNAQCPTKAHDGMLDGICTLAERLYWLPIHLLMYMLI